MTEQTDEPSEDVITVKSVAEYLEAVAKITDSNYGKFVFRGQGRINDPISSSAARRLKISHLNPDEQTRFEKYNTYLITEARRKGYHRKGAVNLGELELLAELQHNGAATGLIDFTLSSLVALYFAASNIEDEDGVVFVINIRNYDIYKEIAQSQVEGNSFETITKDAENKLLVWEPSDINNRIPKQHSIFIFGKPIIERDYVDKIRIAQEAKYSILSELQKMHNIGEIPLFSDIAGFAKANSSNKPFYDPEFFQIMHEFRSEYFKNDPDYEKCQELLDKAYKVCKRSLPVLYLKMDLMDKSHNSLINIQEFIELTHLEPSRVMTNFQADLKKWKVKDLKYLIIDLNSKMADHHPLNEYDYVLHEIVAEKIQRDKKAMGESSS